MKTEEKTAAIRKTANLITNFVLLKQAGAFPKAVTPPSSAPTPAPAPAPAPAPMPIPKPPGGAGVAGGAGGAGGALASIMASLKGPQAGMANSAPAPRGGALGG